MLGGSYDTIEGENKIFILCRYDDVCLLLLFDCVFLLGEIDGSDLKKK